MDDRFWLWREPMVSTSAPCRRVGTVAQGSVIWLLHSSKKMAYPLRNSCYTARKSGGPPAQQVLHISEKVAYPPKSGLPPAQRLLHISEKVACRFLDHPLVQTIIQLQVPLVRGATFTWIRKKIGAGLVKLHSHWRDVLPKLAHPNSPGSAQAPHREPVVRRKQNRGQRDS